MQKVQKGFTLVELIVVIVLLGILGVTALGKFQDLSGNAEQAALDGIAAEISGASSINYAKSLLDTAALGIGDAASGGSLQLNTASGSNACLKSGLANLMTSGIPNIGSSVVSVTADVTGKCAANSGDSYTCALTSANGAASTANIICTE